MYKVNDYLIFKKDTCQIVDIVKIKDREYYVLSPINDLSLTIKIPTDTNCIRSIMSKEDITNLINNIPSIDVVLIPNEKLIEQEYKKLLNDGSHESLIKIIKTTYLRNENRRQNNKKISDRDETYFKMAETLLYSEISVALDISYEDAKKYVISKVNENEDNK